MSLYCKRQYCAARRAVHLLAIWLNQLIYSAFTVLQTVIGIKIIFHLIASCQYLLILQAFSHCAETQYSSINLPDLHRRRRKRSMELSSWERLLTQLSLRSRKYHWNKYWRFKSGGNQLFIYVLSKLSDLYGPPGIMLLQLSIQRLHTDPAPCSKVQYHQP